jgi:hypothetical protein
MGHYRVIVCSDGAIVAPLGVETIEIVYLGVKRSTKYLTLYEIDGIKTHTLNHFHVISLVIPTAVSLYFFEK